MSTRSWVQDPATGKLVPKASYHRAGPTAPDIMRPFDPVITDEGERIVNRRQLQSYLRETNQCSAWEHDNVMKDHERHRRERKAVDLSDLKRACISAVNNSGAT